MSVIRFHPTPNPNSLKFTSDGSPFIPSGMGAYANAAEAASDPLASALFDLEGVTNVLVLPAFVTVTKSPDVEWDRILPQIEDVLVAHIRSTAP